MSKNLKRQGTKKPAKPTKERAIRASWIVMKEDGHWMLAAYHNCERDAD